MQVRSCVRLFQQAIHLDPNFAMAYASLGTSHFNLGEFSLGAQWTRKAYQLRDRNSQARIKILTSLPALNATALPIPFITAWNTPRTTNRLASGFRW